MTEEERKSYELLYEKIIFVDKYRILKPHWIKFHNYIEKLQKENEELKNKVIKRDNDIIYLEETAEKEFLTKQEVKENYIPKDKIKELIKEDSEIDTVEFEDDEDLNYERKIIDVDYIEELLEEE